MATRRVPFSPYAAADKLGALNVNIGGGINWSYAFFDNEEACDAFIAACTAGGYRTRSKHAADDPHMGWASQVGPGTWAVQYHHYEN